MRSVISPIHAVRARDAVRATSRVILATLTALLVWSHTPHVSTRAAELTYHVVQPGDTWPGIAAAYVVPLRSVWQSNGVVNPNLLRSGQRLLIPGGTSQANAVVTYNLTEQPSLIRAAVLTGNQLSTLLTINAIGSMTGAARQMVAAPDHRPQAVASSPPTPPPTPAPLPTPAPTSSDALQRSRLGIQGHFSIPDEDRQRLLDKVAYQLEFTWVKVQVDWSLTEYAPGQYSVELDKLDAFVEEAFDRNLRVLLSVVKAPDWARSTTEEDGPPVDYTAYYNFLRTITQRYRGKIAAIEVWNEPNLRREWNGAALSGAEYVRLLSGAYSTIKQEDGNILVISAGLAPTGVNSEIAVNDRLYLRDMYQAGVASYADAIGIHPYGWANPPWARCCGDSGGVPSHNNDPSFFFLNTIEDYRAIQVEFGDSRQLWATEFGWGTVDGLDLPIPAEQPFFAYLSQSQQGTYIIEAYRMAQQWDFMGPMFLWNLNVATLEGHIDPNQAGYSIMIEVDRPREAYRMLRDIPKSDQ